MSPFRCCSPLGVPGGTAAHKMRAVERVTMILLMMVWTFDGKGRSVKRFVTFGETKEQ